MYKFQDCIDKQLESSKGKNLFHKRIENNLKFSRKTLDAILKIEEINQENADILIDYTTDKVIQQFYRSNQYFSFNREARNNLRKIYSELFHKLRDKKTSIDLISKKHYLNLKKWLISTNSFAEIIYSPDCEIIEDASCFEYSPDLQIEILRMNVEKLIHPVLDIGCGKSGGLAVYLHRKGIETFGIDRFSSNIPFVHNIDWLEFDYGIEKWGTIISHLGFSNHFIHHNLRTDGNYIGYVKKYMEILNSLKQGGSFHYAPDLPFIEQYLAMDKFQIVKYNIKLSEYKATVLKKMER